MDEEEIKNITVEKLKALPEDIKVSICSEGAYSREELISHVIESDKIGKKMMQMFADYVKFISRK